MNQDQGGNFFGKWEIAKNTWCISNRWSNFMYLLIGEDKALLIDTGTGEGNIRRFVETITDKEIIVANTHGHFDHTGGNFWWPVAYMHKDSAKCAKTSFDSYGKEWFEDKEFPDYDVKILKDGDVISLGGRNVKVFEIGAHNEGSLAFLDDATRGLFVGDELESGQVLFFVRNQNIELKEVAKLHKGNMERIKNMRDDFDLIWPSHNGAPLLPERYLDDFIILDQQLIDGTALSSENTGGYGFPTNASGEAFGVCGKLKRASYGVASVVYVEE